MGTYDLQSTRAKLDRAKQHLDEFKAQLNIDWKKQKHGIVMHDDFKSRETIVKIAKPRALFIEYSITVGEIVHQMRSALEQLIWKMVPNPKEGTTGFPVFDLERRDPANPDKRYYDRHGVRMIKGINPKAATIIRGLQPFATGSDQRLHLLNEMWNRDKHRLLNLTTVLPLAISFYYAYPDGRSERGPYINVPDLDDGAEACRIPHPANYISGKVKMQAQVAFSLQFTDGPAKGKSPEELLNSLLRFATDIVHRLAQTL